MISKRISGLRGHSMASRPPDFAPLLAALCRELRRRDLPFMFIGGQAVLLHGSPRLTHDVDLALGVGPEGIQSVLKVCEAAGLRPLASDPARFAQETFVCPALHEASGVRVDFIFATTPFEEGAIRRAGRVRVGGESTPFATAEDLILLKLFAGRPRDIEDARSVVRRQNALDWPYLERWGGEFATIEGREYLPDMIRELRELHERPSPPASDPTA